MQRQDDQLAKDTHASALKITEEKLQAILNSVVDGVITIDKNGVIEANNPAADKMFGYEPGELLGQNIKLLMPSPHAEEHQSYVRNYIETGEAKIIGIGRELVARRKDGSTFPIELSVSEVDHLSIFTGVIRDITERKYEQQRLLESERMAGLGQATAGLVHESRNSIARIQANLRMAKRRIADDPEVLQFVDHAIEASENLERQFEEVREYSAPVKPKSSPVDLKNLVIEAWSQLDIDEQARQTSLKLESGTDQTIAEVDRFLMTNAFRNILQNALDAVASEGSVTVTFKTENKGGQDVIHISFENDGQSIAPEDAERAFEAFYTTKTQGTGLGLAIVKRYVESHGGTIAISPVKPEGTTVDVTLPVTNQLQETPR